MAATPTPLSNQRLLMSRAPHFHPEYISIPFVVAVSFCFQPAATIVFRNVFFSLKSLFINFFIYASLVVQFHAFHSERYLPRLEAEVDVEVP